MFTSILAAIGAIPKLVDLIQQLLGFFKKAEDEKWFAEKSAAFQDLEKAQTLEEYQRATKALHDSLKRL